MWKPTMTAIVYVELLIMSIFYSGCTSRHINMNSKVPDLLKVPMNQQLSFALRGEGVQIYSCKAVNNNQAGFDWAFISPEADLFDDQGNKVGKHYAGPSWEANDGSKIVGEVLAKDNGPNSDAIPWLLLRVKAKKGLGIFSQIVSVQRLNTNGGKAPADVCAKVKVGKEIRIPYSADYYFYSDKY